jgi:glutamate N-acetyltransferase/amino-acid N-acetyltransferase
MRALPFYPQGFRSGAKNVGLKDETLDFTIIASDVPAAAAAMFTQNRFCGAAIIVGREHIANGRLQAFVINSKNANVATGEHGFANIRELVRLVAQELEIAPEDVLPHSGAWQLRTTPTIVPEEHLRQNVWSPSRQREHQQAQLPGR